MKILFLPNWTVHKLNQDSPQYQAPDKYVEGQSYWFFRYFIPEPEVDIIDIKPKNIIHRLEVKLKFYILQGILAYKVQNKYDVVISHGAQSGVMLALLRKLFGNSNVKHVIFDIGGMNGAKSDCFSTALIRFALKSNPYIICHSLNILDNICNNYPFLVDRTKFIPFGVGLYQYEIHKDIEITKNIFVFAGPKRDVSTVVNAWRKIINEKKDAGYVLNLVGNTDEYNLSSCNSVRRLDYCEYKQFLESSSFVILPLEELGYSYGQMSLLGSLALGKKVIASNVGGISDYTSRCKSVDLIAPNNVDAMKDAIERVISTSNDTFDRSLPRKEVTDYFDERIMARNIEIFINNLC